MFTVDVKQQQQQTTFPLLVILLLREKHAFASSMCVFDVGVFLRFMSSEPGRVAQSVGHLTRK